jgi:hypothetical protein
MSIYGGHRLYSIRPSLLKLPVPEFIGKHKLLKSILIEFDGNQASFIKSFIRYESYGICYQIESIKKQISCGVEFIFNHEIAGITSFDCYIEIAVCDVNIKSINFKLKPLTVSHTVASQEKQIFPGKTYFINDGKYKLCSNDGSYELINMTNAPVNVELHTGENITVGRVMIVLIHENCVYKMDMSPTCDCQELVDGLDQLVCKRIEQLGQFNHSNIGLDTNNCCLINSASELSDSVHSSISDSSNKSLVEDEVGIPVDNSNDNDSSDSSTGSIDLINNLQSKSDSGLIGGYDDIEPLSMQSIFAPNVE